MDKDRKVKKIMNGKVWELPSYKDVQEDTEFLTKTEYNKNAVKVISEMIQNWENYKTWYIHLYGEDCYEKMYEMVYNDDDVIYDEQQDYEDDILTQDNIYTDEDDDDY